MHARALGCMCVCHVCDDLVQISMKCVSNSCTQDNVDHITHSVHKKMQTLTSDRLLVLLVRLSVPPYGPQTSACRQIYEATSHGPELMSGLSLKAVAPLSFNTCLLLYRLSIKSGDGSCKPSQAWSAAVYKCWAACTSPSLNSWFARDRQPPATFNKSSILLCIQGYLGNEQKNTSHTLSGFCAIYFNIFCLIQCFFFSLGEFWSPSFALALPEN